MPTKQLSQTAKSLITILNNVNELVSKSNSRSEARDVMKAMRIYAQNKNYPIPDSKIEDFLSILLDSRPITVTYLLRDIATEIAMSDVN